MTIPAAPEPETVEFAPAETRSSSGAAGCAMYLGGTLLYGIGLFLLVAAVFIDGPAEEMLGWAFTLTATVPAVWGVVLCRTGLRSSLRRVFTIHKQMILIAALAAFLALLVESPGQALAILGCFILFWPIGVYVANVSDDAA